MVCILQLNKIHADIGVLHSLVVSDNVVVQYHWYQSLGFVGKGNDLPKCRF